MTFRWDTRRRLPEGRRHRHAEPPYGADCAGAEPALSRRSAMRTYLRRHSRTSLSVGSSRRSPSTRSITLSGSSSDDPISGSLIRPARSNRLSRSLLLDALGSLLDALEIVNVLGVEQLEKIENAISPAEPVPESLVSPGPYHPCVTAQHFADVLSDVFTFLACSVCRSARSGDVADLRPADGSGRAFRPSPVPACP